MLNFKRPYLEPYRGRTTRHACPSCKQPKAFTLYLDGNTGRPINAAVGRCDREVKCGYHYTPKQFYENNIAQYQTSRSLKQTKDNSNQSKVNSNQSNQKSNQSNQNDQKTSLQSVLFSKQQEFDFIPHKFVVDSTSYNSNFIKFLCSYFPKERIDEAMDNYALGATRNRRVIFWQIDMNGNVRTGKIMQYNPSTGRRVKGGYGGIDWVHNILKKRNPMMANFRLSQCYFGEHLLRIYPKKPVAIVEAEKTAVIGSMVHKDFIWLAAGNLQGLTPRKSRVLADRDVVLYPDAGCYEKWTGKLARLSRSIRFKAGVSSLIEKHATSRQLDDGYDIADYIIDELSESTCEEIESSFRASKAEGVEGSDVSSKSDENDDEGLINENDELLNDKLKSEKEKPPEPKEYSNKLMKMIAINPCLEELINEFGLEEV